MSCTVDLWSLFNCHNLRVYKIGKYITMIMDGGISWNVGGVLNCHLLQMSLFGEFWFGGFAFGIRAKVEVD